MAVMASAWSPQLHAFSFLNRIYLKKLEGGPWFGVRYQFLNWNRKKAYTELVRRAVSNSANSDVNNRIHGEAVVSNAESENDKLADSENPLSRLQEAIISLPPVIFLVKNPRTSFAVGICFVTTLLAVAVRVFATRKSSYSHPGSVAELVRRGQLRSDRRGISRPLKYEDPFNNPLVKVGKENSTIEMCGKVYRLAPVTLTEEQQAIHQKRRSRAYNWRRPTVFLKEGDSIPPDVDPDSVRWIPANHPFATTTSDINEDLAQNNVHQKRGVPFRIQAEHEALQKKLEALQMCAPYLAQTRTSLWAEALGDLCVSWCVEPLIKYASSGVSRLNQEQKFDNLVIDPLAAKDLERPFRSHVELDDQVKPNTSNSKVSPKSPKSDNRNNSFGSI